MIYDKDFVRKLLRSGKSVHEMLNEGMNVLLNDMLQVEAEDFVLGHNLQLPDGRNRLVLNGTYGREILSPVGKLKVKVPTVLDRGGDTPVIEFRSAMLPRYLRRLDDFSDLVPWMYLFGFSTAQFGEVLKTVYGDGFGGLSASTVSDMFRSWDTQHAEWAKRDLGGQFFPYLWADGVNFHVRGNGKSNQSVLLILGYNMEGRKELLAMSEGFVEDSEIWRGMFMDVADRGLVPPLLMVGDEGKGLWKGLAGVFPDCGRQGCWFHKQLNVRSALPVSVRRDASAMLRDVQIQTTRAAALKRVEAFRRRFEEYPAAVSSLTRNSGHLLRYYDFPKHHWIHLRTNNISENVFSTVRLRTGRTRGMASRKTLFSMVFKLAQVACRRSRAMNRSDLVPLLRNGARFVDGMIVGEGEGDGGR
jgi:transposase-like protein